MGRAVGLRGELDVYVESDYPERFAAGSILRIQDDDRTLTVRAVRRHRQRTIVSFEGIDDRTAAEELQGLELVIPLSDARSLADEEFWDHELVGCDVYTTDGQALGQVQEVMHPPANDVLVVRREGVEHLIPLIRTVVQGIDRRAKRIVIVPVPGLLDPE